MKYISVDDLQAYCDNQKYHSITPNEFQRMNHIEIVRCKDCRYSLPSSENFILCIAPCESQYPKAYKPIDWYCAGGERKEGDVDADGTAQIPG